MKAFLRGATEICKPTEIYVGEGWRVNDLPFLVRPGRRMVEPAGATVSMVMIFFDWLAGVFVGFAEFMDALLNSEPNLSNSEPNLSDSMKARDVRESPRRTESGANRWQTLYR